MSGLRSSVLKSVSLFSLMIGSLRGVNACSYLGTFIKSSSYIQEMLDAVDIPLIEKVKYAA
jgi:hypothetical protein